MVHLIHFTKRSWMIEFATSACQRILPNCLHPDWRKKKTPLWQCSHQLLPQQASRVPPFFLYSEGLGVLCRYFAASAQAGSSTVRTLRLEIVHWQQQTITEMCSATQRQTVCLCTHRSLDYTEWEVWNSEICAGKKIGYDQHKWFICVDQMVNFLLGQQSGFTKYPCLLYMLGHYTKKYWTLREELVLCKERNVINDLLVNRERILFPPLHIKLGLLKQFTKALDKDGDCFTYLCQAFPGLTMEKLKAGIFDSHQRSRVENSVNEVELKGWKAFVLVEKNFLYNNKARNKAEIVNNMLIAFRNLGCNMSVKMHYLFSHMDRFPENLGSISDEQGERFNQGLKEMGTGYQDHWDAVMMAD